MSAPATRRPRQTFNGVACLSGLHFTDKPDLGAGNHGRGRQRGVTLSGEIPHLDKWQGSRSDGHNVIVNLAGEELALDQQNHSFRHDLAYLTILPQPAQLLAAAPA